MTDNLSAVAHAHTASILLRDTAAAIAKTIGRICALGHPKASSTYRYRNAAHRREYQRDLMRRRRAAKDA
jgi:hypothetical protein